MASAMMSRCTCPPLTAARLSSAAQRSAPARTLSPASPAHRRQSCSKAVVAQAAAAEGELEARPEKLRLAELRIAVAAEHVVVQAKQRVFAAGRRWGKR